MGNTKAPAPPADFAERGAAFWREVTGSYELRSDETQLLAEACRCLDRLDALREAVAADGLVVRDTRGRVALHPAATEERQVRLLLRLLLGQLDLPDPATGETDSTKRGRAAAEARWRRAS